MDFFVAGSDGVATSLPCPSLILFKIPCVVFVSFLLFLVERIEAIEPVRIVQKLAITVRNQWESL